LFKRFKNTLRLNAQNYGEEQYFSIEEYLRDEKTSDLIHSLINEDNPYLPEDVQQRFRGAYIKNEISDQLLLRYVSLLLYLRG